MKHWRFFGGPASAPMRAGMGARLMVAVLGATLMALLLSGCPQRETQQAAGSVEIIEPQDGAEVRGPTVVVRLEAKGITIKAPGGAKKAGEGHFHVWLDNERQITANREITYTDVRPGRHEIIVELVQNDHASFSPKIEKQISIEVVGSSGAESPTTSSPTTSTYRY